MLQGKYTRAADSVWVIFKSRCIGYAGNRFGREDIILFKFIKAVIRHAEVSG
jgi:hypothetical protein